MSENYYVLQRQFSELNVMLPHGSCAALNLNISLERKGIRISRVVVYNRDR